MADLHPVQTEMLRLEALFDDQGCPPVDECIRQLARFEGSIDELDPVLQAEAKRAVRLARDYYGKVVPHTLRPVDVAAIGFLQGVTFAAAVQEVNGR